MPAARIRRRLLLAATNRPLGALARLFQDRTIATRLIERIWNDRLTMVTRARLRNLYEQCRDPALPPGALVECGVARGGCLALMAFCSKGRRQVWGFDSFAEMPPLTSEDEGHGQEWVGVRCADAAGAQGTFENLSRLGLLKPWVHVVAGWFEETLSAHAARVGAIAVLRLDNDWYKSTRFCLEQFYDAVVPGGVVIIDDYHSFTGCRKAVDEFRAARVITSAMVTTEHYSEAYWRKPAPGALAGE